jgi:hypothetical protein
MGQECSTIREKNSAYKMLGETLKRRNHWEDLDVDGRIILK